MRSFEDPPYCHTSPAPPDSNILRSPLNNSATHPYRADAATPLVEELLSKGPLSEEEQRVLKRLDELRAMAALRENYHREAARVERAIAEAPRREQAAKIRNASQVKLRRKYQENLEIAARKAKEQEKRAREEHLRNVEKAREQFREEEERRQLEIDEAKRQAELERIREVHRLHILAVKAQQKEEAEIQQRWQTLRREHEIREEEARKAKEAREAARLAQLEEQRIAREAEQAARRARMEKERKAREAEAAEAARRAQMERERREREEAAWRARMEHERRQREEEARRAQLERERAARANGFVPPANAEIRTLCDHYELKWAELKTNTTLRDVTFAHFPFPALSSPLSHPEDITYERVREFMFHEYRDCNIGKTQKAILKIEALRWHPDRFDALIRPKVREEDWLAIREAAGLVARCVMRLLADA